MQAIPGLHPVHLVECKWAADYVAGESLSAFGIVAFAANAIVTA